MARFCALLVLALVSEATANQYGPQATVATVSTTTAQKVCANYNAPHGCNAGYELTNLQSTVLTFSNCCKKKVTTTTDPNAGKNSETTTPAAHPNHNTGNGHGVTTPQPWYEQKKIKNGLIGGAAAAGLATFAGLGISAIVQANKASTAPPLITTPWAPMTIAPATTQPFSTFLLTTPVINAREADESSSSPLLLGLLGLLALCCCLGALGFCVFMKTRKPTTKRKPRPLPRQEEEMPLVHAAPPPVPTPPPATGHYEQPMMMAPVSTTASYVPQTTVMPAPTASVMMDTNHDGRANMLVTGVDMNHDGIPDMLQQPQTHMVAPSTSYATGSMYAPQTTYPMGSMYGPSSVYAPATTQYTGISGAQMV